MALHWREFLLGGQVNEDGTERLDVALLACGSKTRVELRLLGWGEGIGWYIQKRMQLDPLQIRTLKGILGSGGISMKSPMLNMTPQIDRQAKRSPQGLTSSIYS